MKIFLSPIVLFGPVFMASMAFGAEPAGNQELHFVPYRDLVSAKTEPPSAMELPPAEMVAQWMNFSSPVRFKVESVVGSLGRGDYRKWGKLIQANDYGARQDSRVSYGIAVFEKGTLWGEHREEMTSGVEQQVQQSGVLDAEGKKIFHIEDRPAGRKVYFTALGFGPGGGAVCAFTFLPEYDLLVTQAEVGETYEGKNPPAKPQNDLSVLMSKVEEYLYAKK